MNDIMSNPAFQEFLQKSTQETLVSSRDIFISVLDEYSKKYNSLAEQIEKAHIDGSLLNDVIGLQTELTKMKIVIKIDDLLKV